jgi:hypothetical protein
MWRNSPTSSSSPEVQALKDLMVIVKQEESQGSPALHSQAGGTNEYFMSFLRLGFGCTIRERNMLKVAIWVKQTRPSYD